MPAEAILDRAEAALSTNHVLARTRPALSIVIVSWNTHDLLRDCLASIDRRAGGLDLEVAVVDNASTDGSADMVAAEFSHVRLVANRHNAGFAAANNQAIREARGRYVLLLNPDTVILDDVLERAIEFADAHDDVGVLGCQVMESPDRVQRTCFRFPSPLNTFLWTSGLSARLPRTRWAGRAAYGPWQRDSMRDVDVVSGMFMLVRRAALDEVGLMDDGFFVYGEEADWCRRFRDTGWRCVYAPVGRILHVDGGNKSTDQASARMYIELQKGILRFHRKHCGRACTWTTLALFACCMPVRWAWWTLRCRCGGGPAAARKALLAQAATRYHWLRREPA